MANKLFISEKTVFNQRMNISKQLNLTGKTVCAGLPPNTKASLINKVADKIMGLKQADSKKIVRTP